MIIEKIGAQHRLRKAVLYIRQSSVQQVLHNRESQTLQYAMRERLATLGWSEIEIIDDDLGLSANGGTARAGFERMVSEVRLVRWRQGRSLGLHVIVVTGSNSSKCAA